MADIELHAQMHSYHAAAASFSPVYLDAARPTQVGPLLAEWRERAASNIGGASAARPVAPPGATPNERSALPRIEGRLPGGQRVIEHAAFFVKVLRIYHATAIGESLPADAVETSFGAIKVAS